DCFAIVGFDYQTGLPAETVDLGECAAHFTGRRWPIPPRHYFAIRFVGTLSLIGLGLERAHLRDSGVLQSPNLTGIFSSDAFAFRFLEVEPLSLDRDAGQLHLRALRFSGGGLLGRAPGLGG